MLTCKTVSRKVSDGMDARMSLTEKLSVRMHLLLCPACKRFATQLTILRDAMTSLWVDQPEAGDELAGSDEALSDAARSRIKGSITKASE